MSLKQPMFKFSTHHQFLSVALPALPVWSYEIKLRPLQSAPLWNAVWDHHCDKNNLLVSCFWQNIVFWRKNNLHELQEAKLLHATRRLLRTKWMMRCKPRVDVTGRCNSHSLLSVRPVSVNEINWDNWPQLGAALKQHFEHDPILWGGWIWKEHLFLY